MADVASSILQWSTTASSNSPSGGTNIGSGADDNFREIQAVVRNYLNSYNGSAVASSGTTNIGGASGLIVEISGTTTITSFDSPTTGGMWKIVRFQGALTLTHNATSLILPGGASITTAAGDYCLAFYRGSGNWTVPFYQKADGTPPVFINGLTAETAPASGDAVPLYDASATANRKMTLGNVVKVVNDLTEDTTPDVAADFLLTYDTSASAAKKALLGSFAASATAKGVVELATAAETLTGTDTDRAVTAGGFAGNKSLSANGYYKLPGGLIIQWGVVAYTDPNEIVTFPLEFPTNCWSLTFGYASGNASHTGPRITAISTTGFTIVVNPGSGGNADVYFMAIGN